MRTISTNFNFIDFVNSNQIGRNGSFLILLIHFDCIAHWLLDPLACVRLACKTDQMNATHRFTFQSNRFVRFDGFFIFFGFTKTHPIRNACVCVFRFHTFLSKNKYSFTSWFTFVEFENSQRRAFLARLACASSFMQPDTFAFLSTSFIFSHFISPSDRIDRIFSFSRDEKRARQRGKDR